MKSHPDLSSMVLFLLENFSHRYLVHSSGEVSRPEGVFPQWRVELTEANMNFFYAQAGEILLKRLKTLKTIPELVSCALTIVADIGSDLDQGSLTAQVRICWNPSASEEEQLRFSMIKKEVFTYQDSGVLRKRFPLVLEELCQFF